MSKMFGWELKLGTMGMGETAAAGGGAAPAALGQLTVMGGNVATNDATNYSTDMTIALAADTTYLLNVSLAYRTGSNTANAEFALDVPSGATGTWGLCGNGAGSTTGSGVARNITSTIVVAGASTVDAPVWGMIRVTTTDAGNLVIKHRRGGTDAVQTVYAGSFIVAREVSTEVVLAGEADITNSSNTVMSSVMTLNLDAGKTYLVEGLTSFQTVATTTGLAQQLVGTNCTFVAVSGLNYGNLTHRLYSVTDNTVFIGAGVAAANVTQGCFQRFLVKTTDAATLEYLIRSEVNSSQVTVHRGSFLTAREVTALELAEPVTNNSAVTPSTVFTFECEAGKHYHAAIGVSIASSGSTEGIACGFDALPSGGTLRGSIIPQTASTTCIMVTRSDNTLVVGTGLGFVAGIQSDVLIVTDESAASTTFVLRAETGDPNTVTANTGSFAVLEEVELVA